MAQTNPDAPCIYQPFGMQDEWEWKSGRIYAVNNIPRVGELLRLTRTEAYALLYLLQKNRQLEKILKKLVDELREHLNPGSSWRHFDRDPDTGLCLGCDQMQCICEPKLRRDGE
jgi:hypothetical protein